MLSLLALLIGLGSVVAQTGEAAEIYIFSSAPKKFGYIVGQILMNGQRIAGFNSRELIVYKMYSEGGVIIEFTSGAGGSYKQTLNVVNGNKYYIEMDVDQRRWVFRETKDSVAINFASNTDNFLQATTYTEDIRNPIATLTKDKIEAGPKNGTGFLLTSTGYIVTNYHVINNATSINVKGVNGDYYTLHSADVLLSDKNNDLAIIKLKNPNITFTEPPYAVKTEVASTGEDIYLLGYPLTGSMGEEIKLTTGVISSKTGYKGDIGSYQVSAAAQPGNSGGPLFDKQGNLIGVINAKITEAENVTYAIKATYLKTLLELSGQSVALPTLNTLAGLPLSEQVSKLSNYVYIIEVNR